MKYKVNYKGKVTAILVVLMLVLSVFSVSVFADITPHEEEEAPQGDGSYDEPSANPPEESYYEEDTGNTESSAEDRTESNVQSSKTESSKKSAASSAAATAVSPSPSPLSSGQPTGEENMPDYVVFGKIETKNNAISDFMTMLGIVLIVVGVVGLGSVIAWAAATRNTTKTPDEEVYEAVGMADARNRAQKNYTDASPARQAPPQQRPVSPTVPTAQSGAPRHAGAKQEPQHAATKQVAQHLAPTPAKPTPKRNSKYNTEEIIREALRDKETK